jgi:crotonobetainyl-CoA:carnitine CoA-transferase CaiB-like acyl-CoA transferase
VIDRGIVLKVDGVGMQNVVARLSATPGGVRFAARPLGADRDDVIDELERLEAAED